MLKKLALSEMKFFAGIGEEEVSCLIPITEDGKVDLEVRCEKEVMVSVVTVDGETVPLVNGKIVHWSGKLEGVSAVQIVAATSFWYLCRASKGWFEFNDGIPMVIELTQTKEDVIRSMIDERLRSWETQQKLGRELSDEEKDDLILDIAHGELEFDDVPDQFGLGYAEKLAEFVAAQQVEPAPAPAAAPVSPAADPVVSSST